jgi:DNA invertase Pin-like site-specific DNA recombinase
MKIGYARVSTQERDLALQLDALTKDGCEKIFQEKASGAQRDRPELKAALDYMRNGDTLVVWKIDRLARFLKQLVETIEGFHDFGKGLNHCGTPSIQAHPVETRLPHLCSPA